MINQFITSLYSGSGLNKDNSYYEELIELIELDSLSPQVYCLMKERGYLEETPLSFKTRLKQKYQETLYLNIFIKSQTDQILRTFEEEGLEVIPLKGVYFAEKYFGHLGARGTSDIDILIKEKDFDQAATIVNLMGFKVEEDPIPSHFHSSFSKVIPGSPIPLTVEIHWDILKETTSDFKIEEFWNHALKIENYQYIQTLSDYHTFYMMVLHSWRHNLDSPRHYLDIIQMIYMVKDQLDFKSLFKDASAHQTLKRIKRTLAIVYKEYPILEDVKSLPIKQEAAVLLKENGFRKYLNFIDYQFLSYDSIKHSLIEVINWLVPTGTDVVSQLKRDCKDDPYFLQIIYLYKQRCTSGIKAAISHCKIL